MEKLKIIIEEITAELKPIISLMQKTNKIIDKILMNELEQKEFEIENHINSCKPIQDGEEYIHVELYGKCYPMKQFAKGQIMEYNAVAVDETLDNIRIRRQLLKDIYNIKTKHYDMPHM
jgi:hypothetical protein